MEEMRIGDKRKRQIDCEINDKTRSLGNKLYQK